MNRKAKIVVGAAATVAALGIAGVVAFNYAVANFGALAAEFPEGNHSERRRQRLAADEVRLSAARDEYARWCVVGHVAIGNAIAGDIARAEALADEALAMAARYTTDWNYGNVIHYANLAKGHAAFRRHDREAARRYLLAAADTPGSPQLGSFGPNLDLAREFLLAGDQEAVLLYIGKLGRFWKMDAGALAKWRSMIEAGRRPNFATSLY